MPAGVEELQTQHRCERNDVSVDASFAEIQATSALDTVCTRPIGWLVDLVSSIVLRFILRSYNSL